METCAVQIGNPSVLSKIESFFNDAAYREAIESSATYNTRLCIERRLRMPFLDSQTGVAQNHSNLFMSARERLPGLVEGQIYTYPSKRWRKKRRQYLMNFMQPRRKEIDTEADLHTISTVENPAVCNEDSKDSVGLKDESSKAPLHRPRVSGYLMPEGSPVVPEDINKSSATISSNCAWDSNQKTSHIQDAWYYDELDMQEIEAFDDPDPDSDYDYEESYTKRKKKTKKPTRNSDSPAAKKPKGPGRGRKKANYDAVSDAEKPFACELCGARYKTRPGLTYHYTHSHKDEEGGCADPATASTAVAATSDPFVKQQPQQMTPQGASPSALEPGGSARRGSRQNSTTVPNAPSQHNSPVLSVVPPPVVPQIPPEEPQIPIASVPPVEKKPVSDVMTLLPEAKERATPSPYCDFCLGDAQENKKTGHSEELVSCSDCGRSGHPTCLQFTPNMIISVRKYRWQCIECKCCSICGTSDNDDQLLFCDDCDRGYHMYCLAPPLVTPPEGSWSCRLCLVEFHNK